MRTTKKEYHVPPLRSKRACVNVPNIRTYYYTCIGPTAFRVAQWCKYIVLLYILCSVSHCLSLVRHGRLSCLATVYNVPRTSTLCRREQYNNNIWAWDGGIHNNIQKRIREKIITINTHNIHKSKPNLPQQVQYIIKYFNILYYTRLLCSCAYTVWCGVLETNEPF